MYIVKKYNLLTSFFLFVLFASCSSLQSLQGEAQSDNAKCNVVRAALDIGSGSTKLLVANVNICTNTINNLIFEAQRPIDFKEDLQKNKKNKFSHDIIQKSISVLNELQSLAFSQGAEDIRAVATSAFRTAANAKEAKKEIEEYTIFKIEIISQEHEAVFAYHAALNEIKTNNLANKNKPIAIWDIGGGSMQIISQTGEADKKTFLGKNASVSFKNKYLNLFTKSKNASPNPLNKSGAIDAMNLARKLATKDAKMSIGTLENHQVFGVGGVHYYSLRSQTHNVDKYDQHILLDALLKRAKLNDKQIGGNYAKTDVTNIALVLGYMQSLKIEDVTPLKINMTHGILIDKELWKTSQ